MLSEGALQYFKLLSHSHRYKTTDTHPTFFTSPVSFQREHAPHHERIDPTARDREFNLPPALKPIHFLAMPPGWSAQSVCRQSSPPQRCLSQKPSLERSSRHYVLEGPGEGTSMASVLSLGLLSSQQNIA